jgi:hypothetical protein
MVFIGITPFYFFCGRGAELTGSEKTGRARGSFRFENSSFIATNS